MLSYFFSAKKEHEKFIKEIPLMDDQELLTIYHILNDEIYFKTANKYTNKELRKVYQELKKRNYASCTGEILDYKICINQAI